MLRRGRKVCVDIHLVAMAHKTLTSEDGSLPKGSDDGCLLFLFTFGIGLCHANPNRGMLDSVGALLVLDRAELILDGMHAPCIQ